MRLTDPYGRAYAYDGETIVIEGSLSKEHFDGCHEAAGIPAPPYDPDRAELPIDPAGASEAEQLRGYLREHRLGHHSELMVTYDPDTPTAREIDQLFAQLGKAPVFPGELEDLAYRGTRDATVYGAVETLYRRMGAAQTARQIECAQHREAEARELIALAERLALAEDALDEAVINSDSDEPSTINSEGRDAQIRHLVATHSAPAARQLIEQAAR